MTLRSILSVCCTALLLVALLAPAKTQGNQGHQGLSDACHVASLFVGGALLHGGLRLYNLSGQVAAGITMVAGYQGANVMDQVCDATASELLEYAKSHAPLDYNDYINQYCGGASTGCTDPLLSIGNNCSLFQVCPDSPLDCSGYIVCMQPMLGSGFTPNELIAASSFFAISWEKGYWYLPNSGGEFPSWDVQ
jgi:hypothetical protein